MHDLTGFRTEPIKEITEQMDVAKEAGVEGLKIRRNSGANDSTPEEVTENGLMEASAPEPAPGDEEDAQGAAPDSRRTRAAGRRGRLLLTLFQGCLRRGHWNHSTRREEEWNRTETF